MEFEPTVEQRQWRGHEACMITQYRQEDTDFIEQLKAEHADFIKHLETEVADADYELYRERDRADEAEMVADAAVIELSNVNSAYEQMVDIQRAKNESLPFVLPNH